MILRTFTEYVVHANPLIARVQSRMNAYPTPFRKVHFQSSDGTRLTAWIGIHKAPDATGRPHAIPREGILLVPGLFTTKDNTLLRERALRFFQEWGYHVLVLDLRGMGESARAFNTGGWKESEDVEAAIEYLRAHAPIAKFHVYAESMGAVAAIIAAARQARRGFRLVDGAILAVSPYPDARRTIDHILHSRHKDEGFEIYRWFFDQLLALGGKSFADFEAYLKAGAKHYGVSLAELYRRSTIRPILKDVNVPLLILLSENDPLVPKHEVLLFQKSLARRKNPRVVVLPWGAHCLFEVLDPNWYWAVLHEYFDFYCVLPPRIGG